MNLHLLQHLGFRVFFRKASLLAVALLLCCGLQQLSAQCTAPPAIPSATYLGTFNNMYYYKVTTANVNCPAAAATCYKFGGRLPKIVSSAHNTWLKGLVGGKFWLGYSDGHTEGTWRFQDFATASYTNWSLFSPSILSWIFGNNDFSYMDTDGSWKDCDNTVTANTVIEIPCSAVTSPVICGGPAPTIPNATYLGSFDNGYYYKVTGGSYDSYTANAICLGHGGRLPRIKSAAHNNWLKGLVGADYWLGINDVNAEGSWRYQDNSIPSFFNWKAGEPNNWSNTEHYGICYADGLWNDGPLGAGSITTVIELICTPAPCASGITPPALSSIVTSNICPSTTINLSTISASNQPSGTVLTWHTGTPATSANKISNPSSVNAGVYFAAFFDASNNCYSGGNGSATKKITASVATCGTYVRDKNRTIDGKLNNLSNSTAINYGSTNIPFARELAADYADGISTLAGPNRPNPRAVSNRLSDERQDIQNERDMAGIFYSWGQFIDHDMTANRTNSADPANISLPSSESYFTNPIGFNRSMVFPGTGVTTPREQTNTNTAWIDASQVYGRTAVNAQWLRTGVMGKMKVSKGNMLPFNTLTGEFDAPIDPTAPRMDDDQGGTKKTFVAGDNRVAEHPVLTSLHTLFVREHNRLCDQFVAQGMINDEEIYQKARKFIGALIQHITYSQWMTAMGIQLKPYAGYNPSVSPDIFNTFSAAAYRWHTMVENDIIFRDNECQGVGPVELPLKDVFFNIDIVRNYDIGVLLKGISVHQQYETDLKVNNGLRNFLGGSFGTDLVSINIQRGRDHGLPSYNVVRQYYTGTTASSFSDITIEDTTAQKMQQLYGTPDNVDLWVGLFAEPRLPGKSIGKTLNAMITAQFEKLRDGDYYFYQNDPELAAFLGTIQTTRLGDVISRNSGADNFQDNVFFRKHCSSDGDDIAHHPCNVQPTFDGWTFLGKIGSKNYFKWNGANQNFADAVELAERIGGHLPQLANLTEVNYVKTLIPSGNTCWLDMVRSGNSWTRSPLVNLSGVLQPGVPVTYFNWKFGEPNNGGGVENRVQMYSDGKWNDIVHTALQPVYAEVECNGNAPCVAGIAAPTLTTFTKANTCPSNTVDISTVVASNKPGNTTLTWHSSATPTNTNKIANVTALSAGTYYAAFFSATNNCYSSKTSAYKVTVNACDPCLANIYTIDCEKNVNNAGWAIVADCNVSVCPGEKVLLSVNPNGYPTTWTGPNGFTANTNDILVGNSVILANAGSYTATVNVNGCIKTKTITLQVRDTDGDGVCNEVDCQPTNPAFPATPGTACNDGNVNTTNDVITADGCGCAGAAIVLPSIVINNVTVNENDGVAILTLQLSAPSNAIVTVQYAAAPGTANAGTDFNASNGTATFLAGTTTSTISIAIVDDNVNEPTELFYVNLTNPTGATIADNQGEVTILDNDAANPCANAGGDSDGDGVCNNNDCQPNNPAFPATPGTACNDGNPNTTNDVVTANGCGCAGTVPNPCANLGGDTDGDGVCNNNDCQPNNPAFPATPGTACNDGNPNTTNDVVTANGCGCAGTPANNNPDCANIIITGTATGITVTGLDGAPVSSLQIFTTTWQQSFNCFANCGASQTVNLPAGSYFVYAKYYNAGYALICEKQVTVTVGGNAQPSLVINNVTVNENAGNASLTVTLSAASATPVTVQFSTANGSAAAASDYTTTSGTLTIPAGSTTGNIVIPIINDNVSEPTETFNVNLTNATGATIADNQGVVTILDNDQAAPVCDNITSGGTIGFGANCLAATQHCPTNGAATGITNCAAPTGGTGNMEIVWLKSTTSCTAPTTTAAQIAAGQDPNWSMIPGATGLTLDPGTVTANTCYLRCSRRAGCDVFIESNIISLTIDANCGGNNGAPNCANISITPGNGSITVGGLGGAPVVSVQVFSTTWQQLHNCFANCGSSSATYPVPAGSYYVYVKYYSAAYQLVCEVNQTVNVTSALAGSQGKAFQFEAEKQLEFTALYWMQKGNDQVEEFQLERAADGVNFEQLSTKDAIIGQSQELYEDYDFEPLTGDNYYRLRMVNIDGSISYSEVKLVNFAEVIDFSLFPNPANELVNINLEKVIGAKDVTITVFNSLGVQAKRFDVQEVWSKYYQMDLRELHEGIYIVWLNVPGKLPIAKTLMIGKL